MRFKKIVSIAVFAMLPILAQAHGHLEKSMPAKDSKGMTPDHVMLEFSEAVQVTALSIQKEGSKDEQKIAPLPTKPTEMVNVPAPKLEPGVYTLKWRAVGDDDHVVSGTVHFTVVAK